MGERRCRREVCKWCGRWVVVCGSLFVSVWCFCRRVYGVSVGDRTNENPPCEGENQLVVAVLATDDATFIERVEPRSLAAAGHLGSSKKNTACSGDAWTSTRSSENM